MEEPPPPSKPSRGSRRVAGVPIVMAFLVGGWERAAAGELSLFDHFGPDWRRNWREQRLFSKSTVYSVVQENGKPVLRAVSEAANAGLVREVRIVSPERARLSWRWKVSGALAGNDAERERRGDDYAARVSVVFETSPWPLRTRAINYVWAAHESAGTIFLSPYSANVAMIVLRSGDAEAGAWRAESRDLLEDYRRHFGRWPEAINAVAVLVDTDNTNRAAEAWFSALVLHTELPSTRRE